MTRLGDLLGRRARIDPSQGHRQLVADLGRLSAPRRRRGAQRLAQSSDEAIAAAAIDNQARLDHDRHRLVEAGATRRTPRRGYSTRAGGLLGGAPHPLPSVIGGQPGTARRRRRIRCARRPSRSARRSPPANFAAMAKKYSGDRLKAQGGELGVFPTRHDGSPSSSRRHGRGQAGPDLAGRRVAVRLSTSSSACRMPKSRRTTPRATARSHGRAAESTYHREPQSGGKLTREGRRRGAIKDASSRTPTAHKKDNTVIASFDRRRHERRAIPRLGGRRAAATCASRSDADRADLAGLTA